MLAQRLGCPRGSLRSPLSHLVLPVHDAPLPCLGLGGSLIVLPQTHCRGKRLRRRGRRDVGSFAVMLVPERGICQMWKSRTSPSEGTMEQPLPAEQVGTRHRDSWVGRGTESPRTWQSLYDLSKSQGCKYTDISCPSGWRVPAPGTGMGAPGWQDSTWTRRGILGGLGKGGCLNIPQVP